MQIHISSTYFDLCLVYTDITICGSDLEEKKGKVNYLWYI